MGLRYQAHLSFFFFLIVCLFASDVCTTRTGGYLWLLIIFEYWSFWLQIIFCTESSKVMKVPFVFWHVSKSMS